MGQVRLKFGYPIPSNGQGSFLHYNCNFGGVANFWTDHSLGMKLGVEVGGTREGQLDKLVQTCLFMEWITRFAITAYFERWLYILKQY
jgi:hypothetical protein